MEAEESDDDQPLASILQRNVAERREQQKLLQQASISKQVGDQLSAVTSAAVTSHLSRGTEQGEETLGEELVDESNQVEVTPRDVPRREELECSSASQSHSVLRVSRDIFGRRNQKPSSTYSPLNIPSISGSESGSAFEAVTPSSSRRSSPSVFGMFGHVMKPRRVKTVPGGMGRVTTSSEHTYNAS